MHANKNPLKAGSPTPPQVCLPGPQSRNTERGSGSYSTDSVTCLISHPSLLSTKNNQPHMSLSILAPMNPICTAMRDFVRTDYLASDNKQRSSECMCIPVCHCSAARGITLHSTMRSEECTTCVNESSI